MPQIPFYTPKGVYKPFPNPTGGYHDPRAPLPRWGGAGAQGRATTPNRLAHARLWFYIQSKNHPLY